MTFVNLLPAHRIDAARRRKSGSRWMLLGSGYAGALLLISGAVSASGGTELAAAQARETDVNERFDRASQAHSRAQERLRAASVRASLADAMDEHPAVADLLRIVAATPGPEIAILRLKVTVDSPATSSGATARRSAATVKPSERSTLIIEGLAPAPVDAAKFAIALESLGLFDSVRQQAAGSGERSRDGSTRAGVRFTIECSLSDAGGKP